MSANATTTARIVAGAKIVPDSGRGHKVRLHALYVLAFASNLVDYYKLSATA